MLSSAVADDVVCVSLERDGGKAPRQPQIKSIVQKQISQDRAGHSSHDGAKLPFDLAVTIPRDRLRPHYGDGFLGAPLLLCRPSKMRWLDHGGADVAAQDKSPNPQGPGEP